MYTPKKAHKYCPKCDTHTHVVPVKRNGGLCPCGAAYPEKVEATKAVKEDTGQKHGWKACKQADCGKRSPIRSKTCNHCGQPFPSKDEKAKVENENVEDEAEGETETEFMQVKVYPPDFEYPENLVSPGCTTPSGPCPYRLRANGDDTLPSDDAIRTWAHMVRKHALKEGVYLKNEALFYWAKQEVNYDLRFRNDSDEIQYLKMFINSLPDIQYKKIAV